MERLTNEPCLIPPEDPLAVAISESIDEISLHTLAKELISYGLEERAKTIALKVLPAKSILNDNFSNINLLVLLQLTPACHQKVRDMLSDFLIHRQPLMEEERGDR